MHAALKQRWYELEAEKAQRSHAHARTRLQHVRPPSRPTRLLTGTLTDFADIFIDPGPADDDVVLFNDFHPESINSLSIH